MKKSFRNYARSFVGGLALGAASFLPACSAHNNIIVEPEGSRGTCADTRSVDLDREELPRYPDSVPDEFGYTRAEYRKVEFRLDELARHGMHCKLSDGREIYVEQRGGEDYRNFFITVVDPQGRGIYGWFVGALPKEGIIKEVYSDNDKKTVGGKHDRQIFEIETPEEARKETVLYREMLRAFDRDFPGE